MSTYRHSERNSKIAGVLGELTRNLSQDPGFRVLAMIAVVVGLLLFLLPFDANQHGIPLACFALLPVLLFGTAYLPRKLAPMRETNQVLSLQAPVLASLFQRPPPVFA